MMRLLRALGVATLLAVFVPVSASAAILWFGGEDTSMTCTGSCSVTTSFNDTTYSRVSMTSLNATAADPPPNYWSSPTFTATGTLWFHANLNAGLGALSNQQIWFAKSPDAVTRLIIRETSTNGQFKFSTRNAAGTITDLGTFTANLSASTNVQLDVQIVYAVSGTINVWFDSVNVFTFSGDVTTNSATQLYQVAISSIQNGSSNGWSQLLCTDEDTRSMKVATLAPQSAGNTQGWTPNTLGNINKTTISDATFISDSTGNVLSQWKAPSSAPGGTWGVKSVSQEARLLKSTTGPSQFDWSWRIGGSDYLAGTTGSLTTSFANYRRQQDTSPATSTTWGISEVYNTSTNQLNIGMKSLP